MHTHPDRTNTVRAGDGKEMHFFSFSAVPNWRGLYYVLGSAVNVMRKLPGNGGAGFGGGKGEKKHGGAARDEI